MIGIVRKYFFFIFVVAFALFGFFTNAQIRDTDIVLDISPQYPNPGQDITATLSSHSINLDRANISWSVDGQENIVGIGKKTFSFKTGKVGSSITLSATIDTIEGQSVSKTKTIIPAGIDLLWEAYDSYTPPFYKGKTLVASQGKFKVVAIPNLMTQSGKANINNLSYAWNRDGSNITEASGWGKSSFIFQNSYLDKNNVVGVKISDITGNTSASSKITLKTVDPKIVFYENKETSGTDWNSSLNDGFTIDSNGKSIFAAPYFFSPKNINSSVLSFDWSLNGENIETPNPKNILSIKPENGQSGNATIKVLINNTNTLFQSLEKQISVVF